MKVEHHAAVAATSATPSGGQKAPSQGGVDPLIIAYLCFLEAANTSSRTAQIHAKQLDQNARDQQKLNKRLADLKLESIPHAQIDKHYHYVPHHHTTMLPGKSFPCRYTTYTKSVWFQTTANRGAIQQANAVNMQISAQRQVICDQLNMSQQAAQIGEANVNSITDEGLQTIQQGSQLLGILENMTFSALLRPQVQG